MAAEVTEDFDDFSDVTGEAVADPGPVTGSRGTRKKRPGNAAGSSDPPAPRRTRGVRLERKLGALQARLSMEMFTAGTLMGMGLPVTGLYVCQESDQFTKAVVELAAQKPEWVDALERIADIEPGLIIGRTVIGMGASLAVDRGRLDPEKPVLRFLGVYSAWLKLQEKGEGIGTPEGSRYVPPPARSYVPV